MLFLEGHDDTTFFDALDVAQLLQNEFMRDSWQQDICNWLECMASDPDAPFGEDDVVVGTDPDVFSIVKRILNDCGWNDARISDFLNFIAATNAAPEFKGRLPIFDVLKPIYELRDDTLVRTEHPVRECCVEISNVEQLTRSCVAKFALRKSSLNCTPSNWPSHLRDTISNAFSIKSRNVFVRLLRSVFPTIFGNAIDLRERDALLAVVNETNRLLAFDDQPSRQRVFEFSVFYGVVHSNCANAESFDSYQSIKRRVESISRMYSSCLAYAYVIRNHECLMRKWDAIRKSPISMLSEDLVHLILSFVTLQTRTDCVPLEFNLACLSTPTGLRTDYGHNFVRGLGVELGLVPEWTMASTISTSTAFLESASTHVGSRWNVRDFAISMQNVARIKMVCRGWRVSVIGLLPQIQLEKDVGSELINGTFHVRVSVKRPTKRRTVAGYEDGLEYFSAWFLAFVSTKLEFSIGLERGSEHLQFANRWKKEKAVMHCSGFLGKPRSSNALEIRRVGARRYGRSADALIDPNNPFEVDPSIQMLTYPSNLRSTATGFELAFKISQTSKALSRLNGAAEGRDDGVRVHVQCGAWGGKTATFKVLPRKRYDVPKPTAAAARE